MTESHMRLSRAVAANAKICINRKNQPPMRGPSGVNVSSEAAITVRAG